MQNIIGIIDSKGQIVVQYNQTAYISNSAAASIGPIRTNKGWFVPQKFTSYFTKSFGQKMIAQTLVAGVIGTSLYTIYDKIDQAIKSVTEAIKQPPMFVN